MTRNGGIEKRQLVHELSGTLSEGPFAGPRRNLGSPRTMYQKAILAHPPNEPARFPGVFEHGAPSAEQSPSGSRKRFGQDPVGVFGTKMPPQTTEILNWRRGGDDDCFHTKRAAIRDHIDMMPRGTDSADEGTLVHPGIARDRGGHQTGTGPIRIEDGTACPKTAPAFDRGFARDRSRGQPGGIEAGILAGLILAPEAASRLDRRRRERNQVLGSKVALDPVALQRRSKVERPPTHRVPRGA